MSTARRSKKTAGDESSAGSSEANLRAEVLTYFAEAREDMLKHLTSEVLRPSRIHAIVEDYLGDTLSRVQDSLKELASSHDALVEEFRAFRQEPCKRELESLNKEIAALRSHTKGELTRLWHEVKALKGQRPAREDDEPEEVREIDNEGTPPSKKKGGSRTRSRRSRTHRSTSSKGRRKKGRHHESDGDSSDSSDSSESDAEMSDGDRDDIRVADRACRKVLDVETYRLHDKDPERDLGLRTTKVLQNLRHLFDGERFDGSDPLTVLHFLEELKITFDDVGLCEGDARHMIRYFLSGEAARLFKGLSPKDKKSYPRVIKWLLRTYVRESMLQNAREEFLTRGQKPHETEVEYSKALSDLAKRCAGMIPSRDLINRFVRGLRPAIRTQVQARMASNTSWAVAVALATEHGTAHREAQKEQTSHREPLYAPMQRRRYAQGKGKTLVVKPPQQDDGTDLDEWWTHEEEPSVFPSRDQGQTIGATREGSALASREPSYASLPVSVTSSDEPYYTPRTSFAGGVPPEQPLPHVGKKVMLPPGVPFPVKKSPQGNASSTTYPCLGCGKLGHWLSDCPSVNNRLKDLALEALRTRKQVRQLQSARSRDPSPGRPRRVLLTCNDEGVANAQVEAEEREKSPEQAG